MQAVPGRVIHETAGERPPRRTGDVAGVEEPPDRLQPSRADQTAVSPSPRIELPDARLGLRPALPDGVDRHLHRLPAVGLEAVASRCGGEEQQRLAEGVELELRIHVVADDVAAAGVARQPEVGLARDGPT